MQKDEIFIIREENYGKEFCDYIQHELFKLVLFPTLINIVVIRQSIDLNNHNLESYLFNKYGKEFLTYVSTEISAIV